MRWMSEWRGVAASLAVAAAGLLGLAPRALAADTTERWYVLEMNGRRAGWMHFEQGEAGDGLLRTRTALEITIGRAGAGVTLGFESETTETEAGEPVSLISRQRMGAIPTERRYRFQDGEVQVTIIQGERTSKQTMPAPPGDWLPPAAAARFVEQRLDAGAETFTYRTIDPSLGLQIVETTATVMGEEIVEALGKKVPAVKWKVEQSAMPGVTTVEYVDERGVPIRSEMKLGGISMTVLASEREVALADVEPAEMMTNTLVRPSRAIDNPRRTKRAVYLVRAADTELPDLPTTGSQRVKRIDASTARVTVRADRFTRAASPERKKALGSSAMIDPGDEKVQALTREALADVDPQSPGEAAEALRRFVHQYIDEKNLDIGLASASEVCRTREGDCTEHAVLLAAMLRAADIPSRVASGLIYIDRFAGADNVFGYHMWTQALLERNGQWRWVDLDATLHDDTPYDAAHVTLSTSTLAEGEQINSMAALASVLGRLEIDVIEVE